MKHAPVIPRHAEPRLHDFVRLVETWNRRINLIGRGDIPLLWDRHILDSAQLAPLLPPGSTTITDLGSGAGFPGLVLAIVAERHVDLVEADERKAAFLREAARLTGADAAVHVARAGSVRLPPAPVVTARALAPLPQLLHLAVPLLAQGGVCLFPKGRGTANELTAARREWHMQVEQFPSRTRPSATLLRLREISPVKPTG